MLEVLTSYPALDVTFIHEILRYGEGSKRRSEQTILNVPLGWYHALVEWSRQLPMESSSRKF